MMTVKINNMSESAKHCRWIVCRVVDGQVWYYGAWHYDRETEAQEQAREVGGFVVENTDWLKDIFKS